MVTQGYIEAPNIEILFKMLDKEQEIIPTYYLLISSHEKLVTSTFE